MPDGQPHPDATKRDPRLLIAAAVLFAAVFITRLIVDVPGWGITLLYDIPVALVAVGYGFRAGLIGAAVGMALYVAGENIAPIHVGGMAVHPNAAGYGSRAVVFFVLGGLLGLYSDRLRRAERELRSDEARFRGLVESAPDATMVIDLNGVIKMANRQAEAQFGYDRRQLIGDQVEKLIPDRFKERHTARRSKYGQHPVNRSMGADLELYALHHDGHEIPVEISLSPLEIGDELLVIGSLRDITERKEAEAHLRRMREELALRNRDLERSNAQLGEFAHIASHDLQEPLRVIGGFVELLARRYRGQLDADADKFIDATMSGVDRLQNLIQALLMYSRVGHSKAEREPVDTAELVRKVADRVRGSAEDAHLEVAVNGLPEVQGDPVLLEQLFENLISNAVKFSESPDTHVEVSAKRQNGDWLFAVKDDGPGVDPQYRERIFEMFKRLHGRSVAGTGIGLAICKRIAELHGGRIWVESENGDGSTFSFTVADPVEPVAGSES
jgi:PAS domain S-box-containing protein